MTTIVNCTRGPLVLWPHLIRRLYTDADLRNLHDERRQVFVANVISYRKPGTDEAIITEKERDANAHLFAAAPELLQLLLDQLALQERIRTEPYESLRDEFLALARRREALLARLKEAGVIE